ncbi:hypothetical protein D554_2191 [Bordetella holmesii 30539]|uniref:N-acetyltransferase YedL n=1 Tax=Bordetella holmesii 1058 TaxID=1247648 RepID=A0ABN0S0X0_9BORD|nr:hypothetical protein D558_0500 [Bordetella holmesii 44057]EWM45756.1 hypothetical protein D557_3764 [Bordetella holmesii 70147]EWM48632.1 hypothetical protein D556_0504 [Bordetella holmesii 41130]EWM49882.1 hypothetical protein D555_0510 [Bordetella holmesii 35009]EXF86938.1 hypothetical protein D554_2191 [Bordetella holmesii 30539]EXX95037.1 hypothetical protein D559_2464 [Bordetella holmesii 1058]
MGFGQGSTFQRGGHAGALQWHKECRPQGCGKRPVAGRVSAPLSFCLRVAPRSMAGLHLRRLG